MKKLIFIITVLILSSCSASKYGVRQRRNHIKQQEIQYEHSIPACKDHMRSTRNWWNRPHNDVFLFIFRLQ